MRLSVVGRLWSDLSMWFQALRLVDELPRHWWSSDRVSHRQWRVWWANSANLILLTASCDVADIVTVKWWRCHLGVGFIISFLLFSMILSTASILCASWCLFDVGVWTVWCTPAQQPVVCVEGKDFMGLMPMLNARGCAWWPIKTLDWWVSPNVILAVWGTSAIVVSFCEVHFISVRVHSVCVETDLCCSVVTFQFHLLTRLMRSSYRACASLVKHLVNG